MTDMTWLATEAQRVHGIFQDVFYLLIGVFLALGVIVEYFKMPLGSIPSFAPLVGRALIAALLLHSYPTITNAVADVSDAVASRLGDLNSFQLVLDRMGDKLGEFTWSWVSVKDSVILLISFLTFFILYFSLHIAQAFYIYTWTLLYVFSPILTAMFVLPATAAATKALFRSLIEVASWKIVWSVLATLLWSSALSDINQPGNHISFLSAISFNVILAGSLLLTPFVVHALAGSGLSSMTRNVGALAIGGLAFSPGVAVRTARKFGPKSMDAAKWMRTKYDERKNPHMPKGLASQGKKSGLKKKSKNQREFDT
ncbi:MAG: hypothetical protein AB7F86_16760 [Bdellovibrionales bacterium]